MLRRVRVPPSLLALLCAVGLTGLAWALLVPAWQAPDEIPHFAYVQSVAERGRLPTVPGGQQQSTEQRLAGELSGTASAAGSVQREVEWSRGAYERWRRADAALEDEARSDGGGKSPATPNPPFYYAYAAAAYELGSGGSIFDRLYLVRGASALLLLGTTLVTWLLAGEVFGPNRPLQLAAAAIAGLQPMATFISASVTPDALTFPLWAVVLWLGARTLNRGLTLRHAAALVGVLALAVLAKAVSYALAPAVLFVLGAGLWRLRRQSPRRAARPALVAVAGAALVTGVWLATARILDRPLLQVGGVDWDLRELASYVWQFYLPRLPFQDTNPGIAADRLSDLGVYAVWIKTGWAAFGSLEVRFPDWVYALLAAVSALIGGGAVAAVVRGRWRPTRLMAGFLALAALVLLAGLHWTEYQVIVDTGSGSNQGRYLLPLMPIAGVATAAALTNLRPPARQGALAALLGALFAVQLFSLAIVAGRFYA
jgi:4-amino-4-deoxy-L-arabinose transferase-like glycosyltransferase